MSFAAEPVAAVFLAGIGWLTACGFSQPPYAQLRPTGPAAWHAAVVVAASVLAGAVAGLVFRWRARRLTLVGVGRYPGTRGGRRVGDAAAAVTGPDDAAIGVRRRLGGALLAAALLPLLTLALTAARPHLDLADDLLIYLVAVVTITVVGGFWPAVLAAVAASLLLNWYFTEPLHTFTIAEPRNLLALLLFVTVAVAVSSMVHLAARRAVQAARGPGGGGRAAGAGADRARRGRLAGRRARAPDPHPRRSGRTDRTGGRDLGPGRFQRRGFFAGRGHPH